MNETLEQLREHSLGVWRFRRVAVVTAWAAAIIGWLMVLSWPDQFEATARVFVNTSTALRPLLQGLAVDQDIDSQLNMVRESLLGRPRLERVAREADLDVQAKTPEELDRLIARLQLAIDIDAQAPQSATRETKTTDSVYTITYRNGSRERALAVVRSLLNALIEDTMSGKRVGAGSAQKFLMDQIKEYETRLSDAEGRLAAFKQRNVGLVPGQQGDYFTRLQTEIDASKKAQSALDIALHRHDELQRQLGGAQPFGATRLPSGSVNGLSGVAGGSDTASRIAETQAKLDELLLKFTEKHPDVVALRETLSELKARQQKELDAIRKGDPSGIAAGLATNPVYQSIQLQLNQSNVEIAALRAELSDHQSNVAQLRQMLNTAPEVEAELARLTRDYTVEKTQYTSLVERLEKSKLSEDAADMGIVQFQVINPPTSNLRPVAPNRPVLLAVVFGIAVALGVAIAWVYAQVRPVFNDARTLSEVTGRPLLGSVTRAWTDRHRADMRRGFSKLIAATSALLICFVAVMVIQDAGARALHSFIKF